MSLQYSKRRQRPRQNLQYQPQYVQQLPQQFSRTLPQHSLQTKLSDWRLDADALAHRSSLPPRMALNPLESSRSFSDSSSYHLHGYSSSSSPPVYPYFTPCHSQYQRQHQEQQQQQNLQRRRRCTVDGSGESNDESDGDGMLGRVTSGSRRRSSLRDRCASAFSSVRRASCRMLSQMARPDGLSPQLYGSAGDVTHPNVSFLQVSPSSPTFLSPLDAVNDSGGDDGEEFICRDMFGLHVRTHPRFADRIFEPEEHASSTPPSPCVHPVPLPILHTSLASPPSSSLPSSSLRSSSISSSGLVSVFGGDAHRRVADVDKDTCARNPKAKKATRRRIALNFVALGKSKRAQYSKSGRLTSTDTKTKAKEGIEKLEGSQRLSISDDEKIDSREKQILSHRISNIYIVSRRLLARARNAIDSKDDDDVADLDSLTPYDSNGLSLRATVEARAGDRIDSNAESFVTVLTVPPACLGADNASFLKHAERRLSAESDGIVSCESGPLPSWIEEAIWEVETTESL